MRWQKAAITIQRIFRGFHDRSLERRRRSLHASRELKAHLEAMRCRLQFAEHREEENSLIAQAKVVGRNVLGAAHTLNRRLSSKGRYEQASAQSCPDRQQEGPHRDRGATGATLPSEGLRTPRMRQPPLPQRQTSRKSGTQRSCHAQIAQELRATTPKPLPTGRGASPERRTSQRSPRKRGPDNTLAAGNVPELTPRSEDAQRSASPALRHSPSAPTPTQSPPEQLKLFLMHAQQRAQAMYETVSQDPTPFPSETTGSARSVTEPRKELTPRCCAKSLQENPHSFSNGGVKTLHLQRRSSLSPKAAGVRGAGADWTPAVQDHVSSQPALRSSTTASHGLTPRRIASPRNLASPRRPASGTPTAATSGGEARSSSHRGNTWGSAPRNTVEHLLQEAIRRGLPVSSGDLQPSSPAGSGTGTCFGRASSGRRLTLNLQGPSNSFSGEHTSNSRRPRSPCATFGNSPRNTTEFIVNDPGTTRPRICK